MKQRQIQPSSSTTEIVAGRTPCGSFLIAHASPRIEEFIKEMEYLNPETSRLIHSDNKLHSVYEIRIPDISESPVIMKVARVSDRYRFARRLELRVSLLLKDRAKRAFLAATDLLDLGIPTARPLACWSHRTSPLKIARYGLFEKVKHDCLLRDLRDGTTGLEPDVSQTLFEQAVRRLGKIVAAMHKAHLRNFDLALGNILVTMNGLDASQNNGENSFDLTIIDTDNVHRSPRFQKRTGIKWLLDMRSLRRLARQLDKAARTIFLTAYLGREPTPVHQRVFAFRRPRLSDLLQGLQGKNRAP